MGGIKKGFLFTLVFLVLLSCDPKSRFDDYKSFSQGWPLDSAATFAINLKDTVKPYNLFINLRNTTAYPFSNIYLIAKIDYPKGKIERDTLQYDMAYPDGRWMGVGMGDLKSSKLWFKEKFVFSEEGTYQISIQQAMRERGEKTGIKMLKGITEVGLRIEKSE